MVGLQDQSMRRLEDLDWFIRFGLLGGQYKSTDTFDVVIQLSGEAPYDSVMAACGQLVDKFGPSGPNALPRPAWNRLAAYVALEKAVAHIDANEFLKGGLELAKTLSRKPRFRPALEDFWIEHHEIPADVQKAYETLVTTPT